MEKNKIFVFKGTGPDGKIQYVTIKGNSLRESINQARERGLSNIEVID